ncbi:Serpentine receptor class beta-5 [Caenorhabditis elegans]|uniref:Serpentine receptor class beta-5 n=1 Tax=Caenorhabditis elegans TaxID=6239 RepID=SRB5_CAEEL|nr:Serpentine receptor class beta-5 [Caenorhabditis elegans]Q95ZY4.1 RecName: Full=Serpentine receptor class beta-5; Short=Protein srb-5 [Caenorhabditis elegans]CCD65814.1 Serpentine receptor class beta-5 [Caenorhabditis elegans]prf//2123261T chemosensory receptor [Caenorhabditis elegans]|eukprot:NP_494961.1 Serpentine receptor class beta-5 [Caenorhabditis elegans]
MAEINQTKCDLAFQISYHPIYRLAQFWTLSVSLLAVPSLLYFLLKRVLLLPFHGNLKCLLITYFSSIFLYALVLCFDFSYQCLIPFIVTTKCSLIIDQTLYKCGHMTSLFFLTTPMLLPFGFSIERFVAVGMAYKYEKMRTLLGPILCFILVAPNFVVFYFLFRDEQFTDSFISFLVLPNTPAVQFNNYLWFLLYAKIGNFCCNCVLLIFHKRFKNTYLKKKTSLSVRYALEEISNSSKFTLILTFTHLVFFGAYTIGSILVRTLGESFFGNFLNFYVARGVNCAVPTYNLLIAFVGLISLRQLNSRRHAKILTKVLIRVTGQEGARNYDDIIMQQWNTVSNRTR